MDMDIDYTDQRPVKKQRFGGGLNLDEDVLLPPFGVPLPPPKPANRGVVWKSKDCWDWRNCKFGDKCKYRHMGDPGFSQDVKPARLPKPRGRQRKPKAGTVQAAEQPVVATLDHPANAPRMPSLEPSASLSDLEHDKAEAITPLHVGGDLKPVNSYGTVGDMLLSATKNEEQDDVDMEL